ncbi:MAG: HAMP domain-containing sensor histidine kinase [Actinomycetota bacterium]
MKFSSRLTVASALAVAVAIILAAGTMFTFIRAELLGQIDDSLVELAAHVSYEIPPDSGNITDEFAPKEGFRVIPPDTYIPDSPVFVQVVTATGTIRSAERNQAVLPATATARLVAESGGGPIFGEVTVDGKRLRVYSVPLKKKFALQVARPLEEVETILQRLLITIIGVALGGVVIAALFGRAVARAVMSPIRRLTRTTRHVAETHDLSRRISVRGGDELAELGATFNVMLEALEESIRNQRQLVADASHELRTPLTSSLANLEFLVASKGLPEEEKHAVLLDVLAQLRELNMLMTDIVDLARGNQPDLPAEAIRLDQLVAQAIERARKHSPWVDFTVSLEETVVNGVGQRLDRAIANLLDNAAKWSKPGDDVEVTLRDGELTVRDHGPGIEEDDLPFIFDRFYRSPSSRGTPGSGLGLAIVRAVAESHGGSVVAENAAEGGAVMRLKLRTTPEVAEPAVSS